MPGTVLGALEGMAVGEAATAVLQLRERVKNHTLRKGISYIITAFVAFMVIGRLVSGVHWLTDIVGGVLLSAGLVMMYYSISNLKRKNNKRR